MATGDVAVQWNSCNVSRQEKQQAVNSNGVSATFHQVTLTDGSQGSVVLSSNGEFYPALLAHNKTYTVKVIEN